jgi:DNA-directed RNA polymerase subunit beta
MPSRLLAGEQVRRNFGKIPKIIAFPNLVEMQKESYARFLQKDVPPEKRRTEGLQGAFKSVFPIKDFTGTASLEFVSYSFGEVKYDESECTDKAMTYEIPMRITVRLVVYETDREAEVQNIRDIKEQEIYFGMGPSGSS